MLILRLLVNFLVLASSGCGGFELSVIVLRVEGSRIFGKMFGVAVLGLGRKNPKRFDAQGFRAA